MYFRCKHVETGRSCSHELATFLKYHIPLKDVNLKKLKYALKSDTNINKALKSDNRLFYKDTK